ncbi:MAG: hypothetical protein DMG41_22640 [Acidobacteria bacterium]|nr:MAG: hypothetical protein AUH13_22925 [Acidobacteria bacterium 13_2_20CM_58_27]PYT85591.1 MAG: hypothetical protein DMG41_22640 [Acidobacteriota bacterium]
MQVGFALGFVFVATGRGQEAAGFTEVTPNVLVFATRTGNVVALVGPDGALLIGTPSADSTERISSELAKRTKSPARYVLIAPEDPAHSEGDAGWGRRGAFVAMQEKTLERIGGHVMGAPKPPSEEFVKMGVDRPRVSFSEVMSFDLNGEAVHIVKQQPGYSDSDALVHFHLAKLVYWGEAFPGDGYPEIAFAQGGTLDGLLKTLGGWTDPGFHVVPARGEVTTGAGLKAFCDMIVTVRDRVRHSIDAGRTENQVIGEHPTAEFDAQWGHGRVPPDAFVHEIYRALKTDK